MLLPYCDKGERVCPPEDCGGGGKLVRFKILSGPHNKELKELIKWLGGKFDPEEFDIKGVNKRLSGL